MAESSTLSAAIADPNTTVFKYSVSSKPYRYRQETANGWNYFSSWDYPGLFWPWTYTWIPATGLSADILQSQFHRLAGHSVTPYILNAVPGFLLGQHQDNADPVALRNDVLRSKTLSHQFARSENLTLDELSQREFARMSWLPSGVDNSHPRNLASLPGYNFEQKSWAGGLLCDACKSWTPSWAPPRRPFAKCHYCSQNLTAPLPSPNIVPSPSIEAISRGAEEVLGGVTILGVGLRAGFLVAAAGTARTISRLRG